MAIQLVGSDNKMGTAASLDKTQSPAKRSPKVSTPSESKEDRQQVEQALERVRQTVQSLAQDLHFSVDKESGKTIVRVVDSTTKEVIRQIPSEEILSISHAMDRIAGMLLKDKA